MTLALRPVGSPQPDASSKEEIGVQPAGEFMRLEPLKQPGGKLVLAWAVRSDFDLSKLESNAFSIECRCPTIRFWRALFGNIGSYVWGCIGAAALARFTTFLGQTTGHHCQPALTGQDRISP